MIRRIPAFVPNWFIRLLPRGSLYGDDQLTLSAQLFLGRLLVGLASLIGGAVALWLLDDTSWRDVVAGALLAWAVSSVVWAVNSYQRKREVVEVDLRRVAEFDLLHARLNQLATRLNAPTIGLSAQVEGIILAREERLAHLSGIEEFRPDAPREGYLFWDAEAMGED